MNGIEKITDRIDADTQQEIDAILAQATAQAAEVTARAEADGKRAAEAILAKGRRDAEQREERLGSVAQLEARKLLLGAKQELVSQAFDQALADLTALPEAQYIALLARLAVAATRTGRESVILSQKDRTRYGKQIVNQANDLLAQAVAPKLPGELTDTKVGAFVGRVVTGASALLAGTGMLTMDEESRPMAGGLILKDDRVETNCSFEVLIHLQRDTLAHSVAKVLFDGQ